MHIHIAAAHPSGEMIGGHCEEATLLSGAFMYLQSSNRILCPSIKRSTFTMKLPAVVDDSLEAPAV